MLLTAYLEMFANSVLVWRSIDIINARLVHGRDEHVGSTYNIVRVFSDVLVAFLYFDIWHLLVANIKIWKSHLNIREGLEYLHQSK